MELLDELLDLLVLGDDDLLELLDASAPVVGFYAAAVAVVTRAAGRDERLPRSATKRDKARWVYLPEWLIEAIEALCPFDDRTPERRVFQGVTEATVYQTMIRACQATGVPHYHPHDLRHRRITIWHQSGVPARELAERAGHAKASMSLDFYQPRDPAGRSAEGADSGAYPELI